MTGSKLSAMQPLQFFLSESVWELEAVNARRLELLRAGPATAPHGGGVLVIDGSGDRKDGAKTAHVGRQWLGRYGKTDSGVVTVTTVWADERVCYPVPYPPARHFTEGKNDPEVPTKLAIDDLVGCGPDGVRRPVAAKKANTPAIPGWSAMTTKAAAPSAQTARPKLARSGEG